MSKLSTLCTPALPSGYTHAPIVYAPIVRPSSLTILGRTSAALANPFWKWRSEQRMPTLNHFSPPHGLPNTSSDAGTTHDCLPTQSFSTTSMVKPNGFAMSLLHLPFFSSRTSDAQSHGVALPSHS